MHVLQADRLMSLQIDDGGRKCQPPAAALQSGRMRHRELKFRRQTAYHAQTSPWAAQVDKLLQSMGLFPCLGHVSIDGNFMFDVILPGKPVCPDYPASGLPN